MKHSLIRTCFQLHGIYFLYEMNGWIYMRREKRLRKRNLENSRERERERMKIDIYTSVHVHNSNVNLSNFECCKCNNMESIRVARVLEQPAYPAIKFHRIFYGMNVLRSVSSLFSRALFFLIKYLILWFSLMVPFFGGFLSFIRSFVTLAYQ